MVEDGLKTPLNRHTHDGLNSEKINGKNLINSQQPAIADTTGGVTIDTNARATIVEILEVMRKLGFIKQ